MTLVLSANSTTTILWPSSAIADLARIKHHPAYRILKIYGLQGAPLKLSSKPLDNHLYSILSILPDS
jgi:hypothetical protein